MKAKGLRRSQLWKQWLNIQFMKKTNQQHVLVDDNIVT